MIRKKPPILATLFFYTVRKFQKTVIGQRKSQSEQLRDALWKQGYLFYWREHQTDLYQVHSDSPGPATGDDSRIPKGAVLDNSTNPKFNARLYEILGYPDDLQLLDLGCAGGGSVRSILEDGYSAVGLEGSDLPRKLRIGEWGTIPYHLLVCDITKPFRITFRNGRPAKFDAITAWDVLEHIEEHMLKFVLQNVRIHLKPCGYFICSIDTWPDVDLSTGAVYHRTLCPKEWWVELFEKKWAKSSGKASVPNLRNGSRKWTISERLAS